MYRLGFDVDDVIVNTMENVVNYINHHLPEVNLKLEEVNEYWIEKLLPPAYEWIVKFAFHDSQMWRNVKMIDGVAEVLEKFYKDGNEIYFCTATTPDNFRKKIKFLERNFSFFPKDYVRTHSISIQNKQLLMLDFLVDDYFENLSGDRNYISICYDRPWNRDCFEETGSFYRVKNWQEIYEIIKDYDKGYGNKDN